MQGCQAAGICKAEDWQGTAAQAVSPRDVQRVPLESSAESSSAMPGKNLPEDQREQKLELTLAPECSFSHQPEWSKSALE